MSSEISNSQKTAQCQHWYTDCFVLHFEPRFLELKSESSIESRILDYLAASPAAQDTLRGIVEWWLLKQQIVQTTADVERALTKLIAQRKVSTHVGSDGQTYYRNFRRNLTKKPTAPSAT